MSLPLVALVGRPNVGKSSIFNRFLRKRIAIVDDRPGITRDRNYSICEWAGREFYLIDTGGIVPGAKGEIEKLAMEQSEIAMEQADLVVLIVDCQTGVDAMDEKIASSLIKSGKQVMLIVNKADDEFAEQEIYAFNRLGLGEPMGISATVGRGIGEALDKIISLMPEDIDVKSEEKTIRIAVIGRPNVGKSSFINKLIGAERVIVSAAPGTTRDAVDTPFEIGGKKYVLVDTAGLRRKSKVRDAIEYYTTLRTIRAIEYSDIAVVLIDASEGLITQDLKIIEDATEARRGIILAINKWDLIEKDGRTADRFTASIKELAQTLSYIPVIYISALTGQRVAKTIQLIDQVYENCGREISTPDLNSFLEEITAKQPPAAARGKYIKILYGTQVGIRPPSFIFFCNHPTLLQKSYLRYLENQLRDRYDFSGAPFRIKFKRK
jgi:GTP-binding protein